MSAALQRKVHKVLDARVRFDQPEVTEALAGLSSLYVSSLANTSSGLGGGAAVAAVRSGESTGAPASLTLHRQFRSLLDARTVSLHRSLLDAFAPVRSELAALDANLAETAAVATELHQALQDVKERSNTLSEAAKALAAQKDELGERSALVSHFLSRFQLDPSDARLLASTNEQDIGPEFFAALDKVEAIKENIAAMLMGAATGGANSPSAVPGGGAADGSTSRISLDLLDSLSKQLESSYELLYRFVSRQVSPGGGGEAASIVKVSDLTPRFIRCFHLLRNVPAFFEHCLQDLLSSRRALLLERFLKALSRGSGGARPIELSAHDPVRYASDLLAWVHQALANEKEFLSTLFPPEKDPKQGKTGSNMYAANNGSSYTGAGHNRPREVQEALAASAAGVGDGVHCYQLYLSTIFEALSRPLRVRIEQSFGGAAAAAAAAAAGATGSAASASPSHAASLSSTQPQPQQVETTFKIWNILKFYGVVIAPILPSDAQRVAEKEKEEQAARQMQQAQPQHDSAFSPEPPAIASASSPTASSPASSNDLVSTLSSLSSQARSSFFALLAQAGRRLVASPPPPAADLSPGPEVSQWVSQLGSILSIFNSALVEEPAEKSREFGEILDQALQPLLVALRVKQSGGENATASAVSPKSALLSRTSSSSLPASLSASAEADRLIYTINVLHAVLGVVNPFASFVRSRIEELQATIETQVRLLVTVQAQAVLAKADDNGGLWTAVQLVHQWNEERRQVEAARNNKPPTAALLTNADGMDMATLSKGVKAFYNSLLASGAFIVPQCDHLQQSSVRRSVRAQIASTLSLHYKTLYRTVHDPSAGFDQRAVQDLFIHTPQHVDLLLDLQQGATTAMAGNMAAIATTPMYAQQQQQRQGGSGGSGVAYPHTPSRPAS